MVVAAHSLCRVGMTQVASSGKFSFSDFAKRGDFLAAHEHSWNVVKPRRGEKEMEEEKQGDRLRF
jgi:hypothetical protein